MTDVDVVVECGNRLGEGPVWHPGERRLYWVDILAHRMFRFDPAKQSLQTFAFPHAVTAIGFRRAGGLVLATKHGFAFWDERIGRLEAIADPEADRPHQRFNDGRVDPAGRFFAGTMDEREPRGPTGALYRLDADRGVACVQTDVTISNGVGWSPDQRTMYHCDTGPKLIFAYEYDAASGELANRRVFVDARDDVGWPDGLTVDRDGFVWSARWDGARIVRYDPAGKRERELRLPVARPTACAFGGDRLDELFVTSAHSDGGAARPDEGHLFRVHPGDGIAGQPESSFAG
jgi:sugar lactone lactonase YvrE